MEKNKSNNNMILEGKGGGFDDLLARVRDSSLRRQAKGAFIPEEQIQSLMDPCRKIEKKKISLLVMVTGPEARPAPFTGGEGDVRWPTLMYYFDKYLKIIFSIPLTLNEKSDEQSEFAKEAYNILLDNAVDSLKETMREVTEEELEFLEKLQIDQDLLEKLLENLNGELRSMFRKVSETIDSYHTIPFNMVQRIWEAIQKCYSRRKNEEMRSPLHYNWRRLPRIEYDEYIEKAAKQLRTTIGARWQSTPTSHLIDPSFAAPLIGGSKSIKKRKSNRKLTKKRKSNRKLTKKRKSIKRKSNRKLTKKRKSIKRK